MGEGRWLQRGGGLHSFSNRWNCMPRRPMALQKVYAAELFFFGQSFRICEDTPDVNAPSSRPPSHPSISSFKAYIRRPCGWREKTRHIRCPNMPPPLIWEAIRIKAVHHTGTLRAFFDRARYQEVSITRQFVLPCQEETIWNRSHC